MRKNASQNKVSKRDEIIREAYQVFYKHGFHAAGVNSLLADSGISKRTLYKYFRSKEALIGAAIAYYQRVTFAEITAELDKRTKDPKKKLLALFDMRREALEAGDYSGCFAINAKLEYEGKNPKIETACAGFLKNLETLVLGLCKEAKCASPKILARQIMILLEGTIVYGQSQRDPSIATAAQGILRSLLKNNE